MQRVSAMENQKRLLECERLKGPGQTISSTMKALEDGVSHAGPSCGRQTRWAKNELWYEWFVARANAAFHPLLSVYLRYLEMGGEGKSAECLWCSTIGRDG